MVFEVEEDGLERYSSDPDKGAVVVGAEEDLCETKDSSWRDADGDRLAEKTLFSFIFPSAFLNRPRRFRKDWRTEGRSFVSDFWTVGSAGVVGPAMAS